MGLDLYHGKFSYKQKNTDEYVTLDELKEFPLIKERHLDLITHVVSKEDDFTIYILPDEERKASYVRVMGVSDDKWRFLDRSTDNVEMEILRIEREFNLGSMHKFMHETGNDKEILMIDYAKNYEMIPVIYWTEIGYQRKGMQTEFYEAFENCKAYFRKEDVLRAATYLIGKRSFQENFIDNFVEGDSLFIPSW